MALVSAPEEASADRFDSRSTSIIASCSVIAPVVCVPNDEDLNANRYSLEVMTMSLPLLSSSIGSAAKKVLQRVKCGPGGSEDDEKDDSADTLGKSLRRWGCLYLDRALQGCCCCCLWLR